MNTFNYISYITNHTGDEQRQTAKTHSELSK